MRATAARSSTVSILLVAFFFVPGLLYGQATDEFFEVPIELEVTDGREKRRHMILVRARNTTEVHSYSASALQTLLRGMLDDEVYAELNDGKWITPEKLRGIGLGVSYDSALLTAAINVPPRLHPIRSLSARGSRSLPNAPRVAPAGFSIALPFYATVEASEREPTADAIRDTSWSYGLAVSPAVGIGKTLATGELRYRFTETQTSLESWEAALIRDFEDQLRITAGTARTDAVGFLSSDPVLGLSIERRDGIGMESAFARRFSTSFTAETPSTADIYVNDRLVRTLRLAPGLYELSDFPLAPGLNDVQVIVTDTYGESHTVYGSVSHAPGLIPRGESAFGASGGLAGEAHEEPLARAYLRQGLLDSVTGEVYGETTLRAHLAGAGLLIADGVGIVEIGGAASRSVETALTDPGYAAEISYRYNSLRNPWFPSLGLNAQYRSPFFAAPGAFVDSGARSTARPPWKFTASVQQPLPWRSSLLVGTRYTIGHDDAPDTSSVSVAFAKQIGPSFTLRGGATVGMAGSETEWRGEINLSAGMRGGNGTTSTTYHIADEQLDLGTTQRFGSSRANASVGVSVDRIDTQTATAQSVSTSVRATHPRAEAALYASAVPGDAVLEDTPAYASVNARFGSSLYSAGGLLGVGRPSSGSFALVSARRTLPASPVLVNPTTEAAEARSGLLGSAVLTALPDYYEKPVETDLPGIPVDYALGPTSHIIETGYRTGTALRIEGDRLLYGRGRLVDPSGEPLELQVFEIVDVNGDVATISFTDERGVFIVYDLTPGTYRVHPGTAPGFAEFELTDDKALPFDLGTIHVSAGMESLR
jgi:outer membrane usher protein